MTIDSSAVTVTITSVAHGLSVNDEIEIRDTRTTGTNPLTQGGQYRVTEVPDADTFRIEEYDSSGASQGPLQIDIDSIDTASGATLGYWQLEGASSDAFVGRVIKAVNRAGTSTWDITFELFSNGVTAANEPSDNDRISFFNKDLTPPTHQDAGVGNVDGDSTQWGGGNFRGYGQVNGASTLLVDIAEESNHSGLGGLAVATPDSTSGSTLIDALEASDILICANPSEEYDSSGEEDIITRTVDATQTIECIGDDSGAAVDDSGSPARTIRGALLTIQTARGDSKCDRGTVYLQEGIHINGGESSTALSTDDAEVTIRNAPGVSKANCRLTRTSYRASGAYSDGFSSAGNGDQGLGVDYKHYQGLTIIYHTRLQPFDEQSSTGLHSFSDCTFQGFSGSCASFSNPVSTSGDGAWFYNTDFRDVFRSHIDNHPNSDFVTHDIGWYLDCYAANVGGDVWRNCTSCVNCGTEGTGGEGTQVHSDSGQFFSNDLGTIANIFYSGVSCFRHIRGQPLMFLGTGSYTWKNFLLRNTIHDNGQDPDLSSAGQMAFGICDHILIRNNYAGDTSLAFSEDAGLRFIRSLLIQNNIWASWGVTRGTKYPGWVHRSAFPSGELDADLDDGSNTDFVLANEIATAGNPDDVEDANYLKPDEDFNSSEIPTIGVLLSGTAAYNAQGIINVATDPIGPQLAIDTTKPTISGVVIGASGTTGVITTSELATFETGDRVTLHETDDPVSTVYATLRKSGTSANSLTHTLQVLNFVVETGKTLYAHVDASVFGDRSGNLNAATTASNGYTVTNNSTQQEGGDDDNMTTAGTRTRSTRGRMTR